MTKSFVSAIVLAAGKSRRMGKLKQLIRVREKTLLEITLGIVADSRCRETVLVLGYQADEIRRVVSIPETTKLVVNPSFEKGMSTSIHAGVQSVSSDSDAALIVLADQPFLKPEIIDRLIEEREKTGASIVFPVYKGFRGNPVLIGRSLFPEMMQISGDIGCRSLFGLHAERIRKVQVEDIGVLIDLDTAEDVAKATSFKEKSLEEAFGDIRQNDRFVSGPQLPERHLVIVGSSDVAGELIKLGKFLKFRVTVVDPLLTPEDSSGADHVINELDLTRASVNSATYVVIAGRGKFDEEALDQAVRSSAAYIALMGSKKRGAELIQSLRSAGVPEDALKRVKCPAGLEIGAFSPEEIALSVMAEVVNEYRRVNHVE